MGHSSLLGLETAPLEPEGRDIAALGPGDNSDSGSDRMGLGGLDTDDPVERHPAQRGVDMAGAGARDIGVDRVFSPSGRDDEDPDLAFIDGATAGEALDGEGPDDGEDGEDADDADDADGEGAGNDEDDNVPGAQATPHRVPPGHNPAPDVPQTPGLPGLPHDGDEAEPPVDDDPDGGGRQPLRTASRT